MELTDPVFFKNGRWYFWDETWSIAYGPFITWNEANMACVAYARAL